MTGYHQSASDEGRSAASLLSASKGGRTVAAAGGQHPPRQLARHNVREETDEAAKLAANKAQLAHQPIFSVRNV